MSFSGKWKKVKKSGAFRRQTKKIYESLLSNSVHLNHSTTATSDFQEVKVPDKTVLQEDSATVSEEEQNTINFDTERQKDGEEIIKRNDWLIELQNFEEDDSVISELEQNAEFARDLRMWAVKFNISHSALRDLFKGINKRLPGILPADPRTFLETCQTVIMTKVGSGDYWHHGFEACLREALTPMQNLPKIISVNINVDGLPIYKSSKIEFWPIVFNIYELPQVKPMIIGIYCGSGKPSSLTAFLQPFVTEAQTIFSEGLLMNGVRIDIQLRCFICDSPARAFIKGVANFNSKHGCLKCTTVGEYSHISHTVFFPRADCERRTNENFRARQYGSHHKQDSPLLLLPIDMIKDFPAGDSLHLLDLGVMKKCLLGWRDGSFGSYKTKWCARDIDKVSKFLEKCKMPSEFHRSVRGLDVLCHWKGTEYRTFLHYLGIIILKDVLAPEVYLHFLLFFCAVTICSSNLYKHFLDLAETLLDNYVEYYRDFYGEDYITSNVHNLTHLVEEVKNFGTLSSFNAYPFENKLFQIKKLLRNGNLPLAQVAKRISEIIKMENALLKENHSVGFQHFPKLKNDNGTGHFFKLELKEYSLSSDYQNKWFLTQNNNVVTFHYALLNDEGKTLIYGSPVKDLADVFDVPIKSSYLNIFKSNLVEYKSPNQYLISEIKSKVVAIEYNGTTVFFPLLHCLQK